MKILENVSLQEFNTFNIDVKASKFVLIENEAELQELIKSGELRGQGDSGENGDGVVDKTDDDGLGDVGDHDGVGGESEVRDEGKSELLILGGGSNILLTKDFPGLVLKMDIEGIEIVFEDEESVVVQASAGENWHEFVLYCVQNDWGGLENLVLIPGQVGAAPMQNIGAYGVEVKDTICEVRAVELATGKVKKFSSDKCEFGYRESVFKKEFKGKYVITAVSFKLSKRNHKLKLEYSGLQRQLEAMGKSVENCSIQDVASAVIALRKSKLPDHNEIGTAGSFFKNPLISKLKYIDLKKEFPDMPAFEVGENEYKIPAGWLIEQTGWKGKRYTDVGGVYDYGVFGSHALVLVNYHGATGRQIWDLAGQIQKSVSEKFGIEIEPEVNVY